MSLNPEAPRGRLIGWLSKTDVDKAAVRFMLRSEPIPPNGWFPVFWTPDENEPAVEEMKRLRSALDAVAKTRCKSGCASKQLAKDALYEGRSWPESESGGV